MAKNTQPIIKRCRALGISPAVMGYVSKSKSGSTKRNPGSQRRAKKSEYSLQLSEKQKVKFIYGVLETQFKGYYEKAARMSGVTGENLLGLLERRLDSVVYRLGIASTRRDARQLVTHGHFTVDGKKVNIPSFIVKPGMVIGVKESSRSLAKFKDLTENGAYRSTPKWLEYDVASFTGKVVEMPSSEELDYPHEEHLIVELYSK